MRRFPAPWTVESIPDGLKVRDANGQSLAYVYARETKDAADIAKVLTEDEARWSEAARPYSERLIRSGTGSYASLQGTFSNNRAADAHDLHFR